MISSVIGDRRSFRFSSHATCDAGLKFLSNTMGTDPERIHADAGFTRHFLSSMNLRAFFPEVIIDDQIALCIRESPGAFLEAEEFIVLRFCGCQCSTLLSQMVVSWTEFVQRNGLSFPPFFPCDISGNAIE